MVTHRILKKKGISPLIATVLLIGFAVALAAVVMTWGLDFVQDTADTTKEQTQNTLICSTELSFAISDVNADPGSESVTIDNRGQIDIQSLVVRVYGATGVVTIDSGSDTTTLDNVGVPMFGVVTFTGQELTDALADSATKVEAIATVPGEAGSTDVICPQNIQSYNV